MCMRLRPGAVKPMARPAEPALLTDYLDGVQTRPLAIRPHIRYGVLHTAKLSPAVRVRTFKR
jgi:hypothetical protein